MPKRKVRGASAWAPGRRHCRCSPRARNSARRAGAARGSSPSPAAGEACATHCPRAPEAILEERRRRREEPCWPLFIPLPSAARAPSPTCRPLLSFGRAGEPAIQTRKGGKAALGWAGGGALCRQKTDAARGGAATWLRPGRPRPGRRDRAPPPTSSPSSRPRRLPWQRRWAPPPEWFVCTICSCCACLAGGAQRLAGPTPASPALPGGRSAGSAVRASAFVGALFPAKTTFKRS